MKPHRNRGPRFFPRHRPKPESPSPGRAGRTTGPMSQRNLELKARCSDLARTAQAAAAIGATRVGDFRQLDTYFNFHFPHGPPCRLKLRETEGGGDGGGGGGGVDRLRAGQRRRRPRQRLLRHPDRKSGRDEGRAGQETRRPRRGAANAASFSCSTTSASTSTTSPPSARSSSSKRFFPPRADDETVSRQRLARLTEALAIRDEDRIAVSYCRSRRSVSGRRVNHEATKTRSVARAVAGVARARRGLVIGHWSLAMRGE